jgi:predicted amidohydrolase
MRIALAQLDQTLGDLRGNACAIVDAIEAARRARAALVVTPELSLCGYPPEDLVLRPAFLDACAAELAALASRVRDVVALVGFPERHDGARYNATAVLRDGRVECVYRKHYLPNYTVFDEERYFEPGHDPCVFDVAGVRVGIVICEDCWFPPPAAQARGAGAQLLVVPNGSPYHTQQQRARVLQLEARVRENAVPFVYVNQVGGQDELVFDGASFVMDANGGIAQQLPAWEPALVIAEFDGPTPRPVRDGLDATLESNVYHALVLGVRDYVRKNGFPGVLLGLSGGVDSALTLAIAVDAIGPARVRAVMMPSPFSAAISLEDAREMAAIVGVRYDEIPIGPMFDTFLGALALEFAGLPPDAAEENVRRAFAARC